MKNDLKELLDILTGLEIKHIRHSFTTMPADHRFATWFIPNMNFEGHDLRAEYYRYKVEIHLFFRKYMDDTDIAVEEEFEEQCRDAGSFVKFSGYDNEKDIFWSRYEFVFQESF